MPILWPVYAVAVSALVAGAGVLAERGLRGALFPKRGVVGSALALAGLLPFMVFLPWPAPSPGVLAPAALALTLDGLSVAMESSGDGLFAPSLRTGFLALWAAATLLLLLAAAVGTRRLAREERRWTVAHLGGDEVMVSPEVGPAVVGVLRPRVVVPRWVRDLDVRSREAILVHEREHVRARDPLLLFISGLVPILMPWNPVLWLLWRRLRLAVEIDCDRRVMEGRRIDPRAYGELLLRAGRRGRGPVPLLAHFGETTLDLERRLAAMTSHPTFRPAHSLALLAGGALLIAAACGVPAPDAVTGPDEAETAPAGTVEAGAAAEPTFTPYTTRPELTDPGDVGDALDAAYPPLLRGAGVGGTTHVWLYIDRTGAVADVRLQRSSGHDALDQAALGVARRAMSFRPARNGDEPVPVWVTFPITFETR